MDDEILYIDGPEQSRVDVSLPDGGLPPAVGVQSWQVFRASRDVPELTAATKAVKTGKPSPISSADLARDALILCQRQSESVFKGKQVKV